MKRFASAKTRTVFPLKNRGKSALGQLWGTPHTGGLFGLIDMALQEALPRDIRHKFVTNFTSEKGVLQRHSRC
ncbi:MAG TPA: hypothetical protein VNL73_03100 [Verrucomicrobiae bacterium]|nr:hypothetical protein [Verrucomicrobiae bacterium]